MGTLSIRVTYTGIDGADRTRWFATVDRSDLRSGSEYPTPVYVLRKTQDPIPPAGETVKLAGGDHAEGRN
jgi:hypothetical protein